MGFNCPKTSTLSFQKFLVHFNNLGIRSKSTLGPPRVLNTEPLDCESSALITRSLLLNKSISSNVGDLYSKCTQIKIGNLTGFRRVLGETTRSGTRALQVLKYTWSQSIWGTRALKGHMGTWEIKALGQLSTRALGHSRGTWELRHSGHFISQTWPYVQLSFFNSLPSRCKGRFLRQSHCSIGFACWRFKLCAVFLFYHIITQNRLLHNILVFHFFSSDLVFAKDFWVICMCEIVL